MTKLTGGNEILYNPSCKDFDDYADCCSRKGNEWNACRKENCPKENER